MRKMFLAFALACALPSLVSAQGIEVGVGLAMPATGRVVVTGAQVDGFGVVRATSTLDSGPQLFVELHKPFKLGPKFAVGPMVSFTPKVNFGTVSNTESTQPIGAGFGLVVQVPSKMKQHINVGLAWMVTSPITQLAPGWADGFQAPRGVNGQPLGVTYVEASVSRIMLTMSVSGFFGGSK